jgi:2'-5' RNA ligase
VRLFCAVDCPPSLTDALAALQDRLRPAAGLRFVDPERAHVTLQFLGETPADRVGDLERALADAVDAAGVAPFEVRVAGLGVFPSPEYVSVVWAGVREGSAELARLHGAIARETAALGFEADDREFTPHVTLARMDDARGKERVQRLLREAEPTVGRFRAEEVRLKESALTDEGPRYETVARLALPDD